MKRSAGVRIKINAAAAASEESLVARQFSCNRVVGIGLYPLTTIMTMQTAPFTFCRGPFRPAEWENWVGTVQRLDGRSSFLKARPDFREGSSIGRAQYRFSQAALFG
jgi:hypothetical protein